MNNNFYKKYLKYKNKYLELKNQYGGAKIIDSSIKTIKLILQFIDLSRYKSSKYKCMIEEKLSQIIGKNIIIDITGNLTSYTITKFLGKGGFGCVFKIRNDTDSKFYVIKIGLTSKKEELNEVIILEELMRNILPICNYNAISYGSIKIDHNTVYFIIFNFKGDNDLFKILVKGENSRFIPKYITDILTCLIEINKKGYHGDLKIENIVIDEQNVASIIDYGFAKTYTNIQIKYPIELQDSDIFHLGIVQTSIDILIAYKIVKQNKIGFFNDLYADKIDKILHTIDNFGLFWLIINCFYMNIFREITKEFYTDYIFIGTDENTITKYTELYFNLNPPETDFEISIFEKIGIIIDTSFKDNFLEKIKQKLITDRKLELIFGNEKIYISFMNLLLRLIRVDPIERISLEQFKKLLIFK
jgi:serine/threonine protein kinase